MSFIIEGVSRQIETSNGVIEYDIFPIGITHLRKYSKSVLAIIKYIWDEHKGSQDDPQNVAERLFIHGDLIPIIVENGLNIVEDCIVVKGDGVTFNDFPHWELPSIIEDWIRISFESEKKRAPWVKAIEMALKKVMKKEVSLSTFFSSPSLPQDME